MPNLEASLSFEQREGLRPLPNQLQLKVVDSATRALVWEKIYYSINRSKRLVGNYNHVGSPWSAILRDWHIRHEHFMADEYSTKYYDQETNVKHIISNAEYGRFFGFLEFVARNDYASNVLVESLNEALQDSHSAYRIIGKTVMPISSQEDANAITRALSSPATAKFTGARQHIVSAGEYASRGDWAASIRESIHAVESAARVLVPDAKTLAPALAELEKISAIHGGMRQGFSALYGFTSDEKGIRHALLTTPEAKVDEADALYMLGSCSAFVSFLGSKSDR